MFQMKTLALLMSLAILGACSDSPAAKNASYQMAYYHIEQPETLHSLGQTDHIAFGYSYQFNDIEGEKLGVLWRGKIKQADDKGLLVQHGDKLSLKINNQDIALQRTGFTTIPLAKGSHDIEVRYEPKWHANDTVMNLLPPDQTPTSPEAIAHKINVKPDDVVVFAELPKTHLPNNQVADSEIVLPERKGEQIVILSSWSLRNVNVLQQDGAKIKAIIALNHVGTISGAEGVPVYRVAHRVDNHWWADNCTCIAGAQLSCSTDKGSYDDIKLLAQTIAGRQPDFWYTEKRWYEAESVAQYHQLAQKQLQLEQAKCGGELSPSFTNHAPNAQHSEQSWLTQINGRLPEQGFMAYYFNQNDMTKVVASEIMPHIGNDYPSNQFHDINAEKFAALWAGYLTVEKDTLMSMQYDMSWAKMRVFLNGKQVFDLWHKESHSSHGSFDLLVPKGKNRLEVEYINHYPVTGFAFHPQPKMLNYPDKEAQALAENPNYELVHVKTYESGNRDMTLPLNLPKTDKPIVLVLESYASVFWQIQPVRGLVKAVIIKDGYGLVSGSPAPVLRVSSLPYARGKQALRFNEYSPKTIEAHQYQRK